jgi:hypothetical protein
MKELLKRLAEAEKKVNELDELLEANPQDEEIEKAWDEAYKTEFSLHNELREMLTKILKANGMEDINNYTVNKMIAEQRKELERIAERI